MDKLGVDSQLSKKNKIVIGTVPVYNGQHVSRSYHTQLKKHNCDNNFEEN